mmetsp:Transcript_14101/g.19571  ORF Transcript_14101/g.19571 Transcript_14101/m.19571 type:complete len:206 (-) Transcript_14101:122-739(-)
MNFTFRDETNNAMKRALQLDENQRPQLTICSNCYENWDAVLTGLLKIGQIKSQGKVFRVQHTKSAEHNYNPFSKSEMDLDRLTETKVVGLYVVPMSKFKDFTLRHKWTETNLASKMHFEKKSCVQKLKIRRKQLMASAEGSLTEEEKDELKVLSEKLEQKAAGDARKRIRDEIDNKVKMFVIGIDFVTAVRKKMGKKLPGINRTQ